jgi:hypothetical protein
VQFFVNGDSVAIDSVAPFEYRIQANLSNYIVMAKATDNSGNSTESSSVSFSALSLAGNWVLEPVAKSLAVGPSLANLTWWSNSTSDVVTRSCLFDDVYQINKDGSFSNILGGSTWLEGWQNAGKEGCGSPIAPHDGSLVGKWSIDSTNGQLIIDGKGLYLGLPKATNAGELGSNSAVPNTRSYQIGLTSTRLTAVMNYGGGFWQFQLVRSNKVQTTGLESAAGIAVYPNPTASTFHVSSTAPLRGVKVFNQWGMLVLESKVSDVDLNELSAGMYFIEITTTIGKVTRPIVKQ